MREKSYFYDLHCHTTASADSPGALKDMAEAAKRRGVDGIAVVDHNRLYEGPLSIKGVDIIPGEEITLENGEHLLAYFLKKEIKRGGSFKEAVREIREQGGYAFWAHPLRRRGVFPKESEGIFPLLDGIETGNAMDEEEERKKAFRKKEEFSLLGVAGSDAHVSGQVGMGVLKTKEKINKESFLRAVKEGEIIIKEEIGSFRERNARWKKRLGRLQKIVEGDGRTKGRILFHRLVLRNYLRINNIGLRKISFNYKKEYSDK